MIVYRWWYSASYSLEFAFTGLILFYTLYQYIKKQDFQYTLILSSFMLFAMMGLDGYFRFFIVIALFSILHYKKDIFISKFKDLLQDENNAFSKAITEGTSGKGAIETRFKINNSLIEEVLHECR